MWLLLFQASANVKDKRRQDKRRLRDRETGTRSPAEIAAWGSDFARRAARILKLLCRSHSHGR